MIPKGWEMRTTVILLLLFATAIKPAQAGSRHGGSHGSHGGSSTSAGTVHVQGYYRKDGTYVNGYDRRAPGQGQAAPSSGASGATDVTRLLGVKGDLGGNFLNDPEAGVVVFKEGAAQRIEGPLEIRGKLVVFHDSLRHLLSAHVSSIDLSATQSSNNRLKKTRSFMSQTGFPAGRPGYVVDYLVPPACGGSEEPSNMQWEGEEQARTKDLTACSPRP
jgi:hypothetical protein